MFRNRTAVWPAAVCGRMAVAFLAASVGACERAAPTSPQPVPNTPAVTMGNSSVYALKRNEYAYEYWLSLRLDNADLIASIDSIDVSLDAGSGAFLTTRSTGPFTLQINQIFVASKSLTVVDDPKVHPAATRIYGTVSFHSTNSGPGAVSFSVSVPTICNVGLWFTYDLPVGIGESAPMTAYTRNSCNFGLGGALTPGVTWRSLSPGIITVPTNIASTAMARGVGPGIAQVEIRTSDQFAVQDVVVAAGRPTALTISDSSNWQGDFYLRPGSILSVVATAEWDGVPPTDVSRASSWTTSNTSVARVSAGCGVTCAIAAVGEGTTEIRVTKQGVTAVRGLVVTLTPQRVSVIGPATLAVGASGTASAVGHWMTDTSEVAASWASSNPLVVSVSATGALTAVAPGVADISATYHGRTGTLRVTASN